ncbi:MAG: sugar phosphate isomerase/epimerase [Opitutaceae bacterium]|nr:sugar phosphate isomerase/epimerase [Opitutaceae bacterium]
MNPNRLLLLVLGLIALCPLASAHLEFGIQLWSLRKTFEKDPQEGLKLTRSLGFTTVETHSTYGQTASEFAKAIDAAGLKAVSAHFPYDRFSKDLPGIINDAKALGVKWVCIAWVPNTGFDVPMAKKVAAEFNSWGGALRKEGLRFAYHPHGYEFKPEADGSTPFDVIVNETRAEDVSFELDVFWAQHGGQDPTALLKKYPNRFKLMHVKDIRKGAPTGIYTGHAPASDNVPVGQGQIAWEAVFAAGQAAGIEYYLIEDESEDPAVNIPESMRFLDRHW